jgi:hypothetical protein
MFYKLYKWNYNAFGKPDLPELNGLLFLSLFTLFNITTMILVIDYFFEANLLNYITKNPVLKFGLLISILLINYFLLMFKGKHKQIIVQFENTKEEEKKPILFVYWYFIISIVLLGVMLVLIAL